jgi:hypothetical protein
MSQDAEYKFGHYRDSRLIYFIPFPTGYFKKVEIAGMNLKGG